MTDRSRSPRKPAAFPSDSTQVKPEAEPAWDNNATRQEQGVHRPQEAQEAAETAEDSTVAQSSTQMPTLSDIKRGIRWGALLVSAISGLFLMAAGLWVTHFIEDLFGRQDWIGWVSLGLLAIAILALVMLAIGEAVGLSRLKRLHQLRLDAEAVIPTDDSKRALKISRRVRGLFRERKDLQWGQAQLRGYEKDIHSPHELLTLAERELMIPLDTQARALIALSAKRVSLVTAVSPMAFVDMGFVAWENLRMLRRLAVLYGGRPGGLSLMRLVRMVIAHLAVTGGIAIGDDLIQQLIGHKITAKVSSRLGEGVLNGALTARIGIATANVVRPLPHIETKPLRFRDFVAELFKVKSFTQKKTRS